MVFVALYGQRDDRDTVVGGIGHVGVRAVGADRDRRRTLADPMARVVTALVAVLILVTVFDPVLVTNSRVPSGVNARLLGVVPTLMLVTTE